MPTILVRTVIDKAQILLQDTGKVRWSDADLLGWYNTTMRDIVSLKPNANIQNSSVQLVAGVKQAIAGVALMRVIRNTGSDGATAGKAIDYISLEALNAFIPDWPTHTADSTVKFYATDPRDPKRFYVYPPQPALAHKAEIAQAVLPAEVAIGDIATATIGLDDIYETAIIEGVLSWAFAEDTDVADLGKSEAHRQKMVAALGGKNQAETTSPAGDAK